MDIAELIAARGKESEVGPRVKFDTEDEAIAHLKLVATLKFGDEVKFFGMENKVTRGVFWGWSEAHALILFNSSEGKLGKARMVPGYIIFND